MFRPFDPLPLALWAPDSRCNILPPADSNRVIPDIRHFPVRRASHCARCPAPKRKGTTWTRVS
jgi:hypothetical protein